MGEEGGREGGGEGGTVRSEDKIPPTLPYLSLLSPPPFLLPSLLQRQEQIGMKRGFEADGTPPPSLPPSPARQAKREKGGS